MTDTFVPELLRLIRDDIADIRAETAVIGQRLGLSESHYGSLSRRVDRMGGDVEQIKRRLEIVEASDPA